MNEADTRAEYIDTALRDAGWGVIYAGDEMIDMDTEITLQDGGKQRVHCRLEVINLAD